MASCSIANNSAFDPSNNSQASETISSEMGQETINNVPEITQIPQVPVTPEIEQERESNGQLDSLLQFALVGCWHAASGMPAGSAERYVFFTNRTFTYHANDGNGAERLRSYSGNWHVDEGVLQLEVNQKIVIEGGEVIDGWGSMISDIEGGTYVKLDIDPPEVIKLEIGGLSILDFDEISSRYYSHAFSLNIGDMTFWRYNFFADLIDPDFNMNSNLWKHWEGDVVFD